MGGFYSSLLCRPTAICPKNPIVRFSISNSKLLSGEFTKGLSGRYVSFRIRPFVYKEIPEYAKELGKEVSITDYLV